MNSCGRGFYLHQRKAIPRGIGFGVTGRLEIKNDGSRVSAPVFFSCIKQETLYGISFFLRFIAQMILLSEHFPDFFFACRNLTLYNAVSSAASCPEGFPHFFAQRIKVEAAFGDDDKFILTVFAAENRRVVPAFFA